MPRLGPPRIVVTQLSKNVGRCSIARWQCNLRGMDVDNLLARLEALQHQRAPVENTGSVVEMKSCNGGAVVSIWMRRSQGCKSMYGAFDWFRVAPKTCRNWASIPLFTQGKAELEGLPCSICPFTSAENCPIVRYSPNLLLRNALLYNFRE